MVALRSKQIMLLAKGESGNFGFGLKSLRSGFSTKRFKLLKTTSGNTNTTERCHKNKNVPHCFESINTI